MKLGLAVAIALSLGACATINPDYYRNVPTAEICRQLMVFPSYNVNHSARMAEVARRGESCGSPADIAAAQRQSDARTAEMLKAMTPPPPQTQTCRWVGPNWVCSTM